MESGNKIKIKEIKDFILLDSFKNVESPCLKKLYSCSGIQKWVQRLEFQDDDEKITVDLFGTTEDSSVLRVSEKTFSKNEIKELVDIFNLELRSQYQIDAAIPIGKESRLASIAIKKQNDNYYCIVFNLDDGESRRNATLYIHGIWKVVLPGFITDKLPYRM